MNLGKTFAKAGLGALTFIFSILVSNPALVTNLIPANIATMTIGSVASALIVGVANWLKNKDAKG